MGIRKDWQDHKKDFKKKAGKEFKLKGDFGPVLDKAEIAMNAVEKAKGQNDRAKLAAIKQKALPHIKAAQKTGANYMKVISMANNAAEKEAKQNKKDQEKQAYAKAMRVLMSDSMNIVNRLNSWSKKCS
ncbi:MAG: hypothetical protein V3S55_10680 [Nitrospiraceae bacterium]